MNSFGRLFRVSVWGESHGVSVGVLIDGCPPGIEYNEERMLELLKRRKPGRTGTTKRLESDVPLIKSGIYNLLTTGSPILIEFENSNQNSKDYSELENYARPGHADFVAKEKYKSYNDPRGGGHFSGRLTVGLVAASYFAEKIIEDVDVSAKIIEIGGLSDYNSIIEKAEKDGDSLGGIIECKINKMPIGLGEPFFDSIESLISHGIFAIPGIKGIEFGAGFQSAKMKGSNFNDEYIDRSGKTKTNNSGGINGGISNGNEIFFRVAVKPTSSISKRQKFINTKTGEVKRFSISGRHDTSIALRMPVIIEAVTKIVIADLILIK